MITTTGVTTCAVDPLTTPTEFTSEQPNTTKATKEYLGEFNYSLVTTKLYTNNYIESDKDNFIKIDVHIQNKYTLLHNMI